MNFIEKIKPTAKLLLSLDIIKTVYFNFRVFPLKTALMFPVLLAHRVQLKGCRRGTVELKTVKTGG